MSDAKLPPLSKLQMLLDETSLWLLFAVIGGSGASMLALGVLLRSNAQLSPRVVMGTALHSLLWGVATFLMTYSSFGKDLPFLLGLSIFSGMGVASFIDVLLLVLKQKLGVSVTINPPSSPPKGP